MLSGAYDEDCLRLRIPMIEVSAFQPGVWVAGSPIHRRPRLDNLVPKTGPTAGGTVEGRALVVNLRTAPCRMAALGGEGPSIESSDDERGDQRPWAAQVLRRARGGSGHRPGR